MMAFFEVAFVWSLVLTVCVVGGIVLAHWGRRPRS